jgi:hypothetical protein
VPVNEPISGSIRKAIDGRAFDRNFVRDRVSAPASVPLHVNSAESSGPSPIAWPAELRNVVTGLTSVRSAMTRLSSVRTVVARLTAIRKPAWLVAVVGALILTLTMLAVIPASGKSPTSAPTRPAGESSDGAGSGVTSAEGVSPTETDVLSGDDPVAALAILLATRARCVGDLSVLCLDSVLQDGSAAMDDDVALIRSIQNGAEVPTRDLTSSTPSIVERNGNAVLLSIGAEQGAAGPPREILVMKGESGWRIRAYLDT